MPTNLQNCPDPETLVDFVLGKLANDAVENCRQHLVECDPCVDTIRGLKIDGDTIHDLSQEAWVASGIDGLPSSEHQAVNDLMSRMEGLSISPRLDQRRRNSVVEDRAAEVHRLLEPAIDENELGQLGKYRILELLGAGSTGVVYLAIDQDLDRTVALKILRPSLGLSARERFIAEARATAKLQHPNVVQIYEVAIVGQLAIISMMWEPGQTLEQLLAAQESLAAENVVQLGLKLSDALEHAHARSLIHRDIKPANVWIPDDQGVTACKILDFGLVRITDEDPQLTCTGMIAGTPCYMSPEQSRGLQLDGRSDLFSLGCVMYQSLTGQLPFRSDNALSTLQSIQRDQPTAPCDLDPAIGLDLSDLIMCLLEKSPQRRPPRADAVVQALSSPRAQWPFTAELTEVKPVATQPRIEKPNRIWKYVATLIAGLGLGVWGLMFGPHITSIVTDHGTIEINSKVDDVKIEVLRDGNQIRVIDLATDQSVYIKSGTYEIRPLGDENSIQIANNVLTLTRGEKEIVTITRRENEPDHLEAMASNDRNQANVRPPGYPTPPLNLRDSANRETPYRLAAGDILGVFVEGVLGAFGSNPPVNMPPAGSHLPPSMGFPIMIEADGQISLPLVKPITIDGKTISEAKHLIVAAFREGSTPILKEDGRILVSLMRERGPNAAAPTHRLDTGDVLGVFVEGVLGEFENAPPVHIPDVGSDWLPSMGFPIVVDEDGSISLPLVKPIAVRGKTIPLAKQAITAAFTEGNEPILRMESRILVSLMRIQTPRKNVNQGNLNNPGELERSDDEPQTSSNKATSRDVPPTASPVYHDRTYDQWLRVARTERDLAQLLLALKGMANLATKPDRPETIEAMMQVVRRGTPLADPQLRRDFQEYRRAFFSTLGLDLQSDLLCREIAVGNQTSIRSLSGDLKYRSFQSLDREKLTFPRPGDGELLSSAFDLFVARIVTAISKRYHEESSQEIKRAVLDFYSELDLRKNLTSNEGAELKDIFQKDFLRSSESGDNRVRYPVVLAKLAPETSGLIDQLQLDFELVNNERDFHYLILAARSLPPEQSKKLIPTAVIAWERVDAKQFPSASAAEYFLQFPKECAPYLQLFEDRLPWIQKKGQISNLYKQLIDKINSL